jgi:hypothetical protein
VADACSGVVGAKNTPIAISTSPAHGLGSRGDRGRIRRRQGRPVPHRDAHRLSRFGRQKALRHDLGFDQPLYIQYANWLARVAQGDLGRSVRTNSEAIIGVVSRRREDLSHGIAIGSIVTTAPGSHVEPVRYPAGAGFFRLLMAPHVEGTSAVSRILRMIAFVLTRPIEWLRAVLVPDLSRYTMMLLSMRSDGATLRFAPGRWRELSTEAEGERRPTASIPEASAIARRVAEKIDGTPTSILSETLFNVPTTAHILGGCCMGESAATGVIDHRHNVFGYENLYVIDGSAMVPSILICSSAQILPVD